MYIIGLFIVKILDNIIMTAKSISTYKGQKVLSSILVAISQLIFYLVVSQVINDKSLLSIIIVSSASGLGNFIAFSINDKFKRDETWQNTITSSDKELLVGLATMLKEHNVKYLLLDSYNRSFDKSFAIIAYTKTKQENKLIDKYLQDNESKYLRINNPLK